MIQTTIKAKYGDLRVGVKEAFIQLQIAKATTTPYGVNYEIEHFVIIDDETGAKQLEATSNKTLSIQEYNQFSGAVDYTIQDYDTSVMNPFEIEQLRLKIGLLLYVQNDFMLNQNGDPTSFVVWSVLPNQWQLV